MYEFSRETLKKAILFKKKIIQNLEQMFAIRR